MKRAFLSLRQVAVQLPLVGAVYVYLAFDKFGECVDASMYTMARGECVDPSMFKNMSAQTMECDRMFGSVLGF